MSDAIMPGMVFEFEYPFVRDVVTLWDCADGRTILTWRPGVRMVLVPPDDAEQVFDAIGRQIATVVSVHKPGRFPMRVFFTRTWLSPDGESFGRGARLRATTMQAFRKLTAGFRHAVRPASPEEVADRLAKLQKQMQTERGIDA